MVRMLNGLLSLSSSYGHTAARSVQGAATLSSALSTAAFAAVRDEVGAHEHHIVGSHDGCEPPPNGSNFNFLNVNLMNIGQFCHAKSASEAEAGRQAPGTRAASQRFLNKFKH